MESESKEKKSKQEPVQNVEKKQSRTGTKCLKIAWKIIEKILVIAIIFISLTILTQRITNNEKAFLGFRIFRVQTGSMIPKYQIGDVILVKEKDTNKIKVGEDVTYYGKEGSMRGLTVTHQVVDIENIDGQRVFHTKGIANELEDPAIYADQINGVVKAKLHILTYICTLLTNKYALYFLGIVPLTIYIFFSFVRHNTRKFED